MKNLLLFCSGARRDLLKGCPTEETKYVGLGGAVLSTAVLATVACTSVLMIAFHLPFRQALPLGVGWGLIIFNLDRWLVSSARRQKDFVHEVYAMLPRLGMAFLFGIIISEPMVLTVFQPEIENQLALDQAAARRAAQERADANPLYRQIDTLQKANAELQTQLADRRKLRDTVYQAYLEEAEGKSGTGIVGKGPVFREKGERLQQTQEEFAAYERSIQAAITKNQARIDQIQRQKDAELKALDVRQGQADGLLARLAALHELTHKNALLLWAHIFFSSFIMMLDCLPILTKLMQSMTPRRPYDSLLEAKEDEAIEHARVLSADAKGNADTLIAIQQDQHQLRRQMLMANNQRLTQQIADRELALAEMLLDAWEEKERQKIEDDIDSYIS